MTPFQRKIRSLGPRKYLPYKINNLPPKLDDKELEQLVVDYRNNPSSIETRNRIVGGHLKLVLSIAARFAYKYKYRVDDLIGESFLSLVEAVIRFCTLPGYNNNITPYVVANTHSELLKYIEKDRTISMPGRTIRYYAMIGSNKLNRIPTQILLVQGSGDIDKNKDSYENQVFDGKYILPETEDDHSSSEALEILDKVTSNFIEKRIIKLRAEGYSYKEMVPMVGYCVSSISIMVQNIEKRFNKIYYA
jgi:hypothetical protein